INGQTILPDSTNDSAEDALQATNRLRRQLGDAEPLSHIEGVPSRSQQISLGPIQFSISGMASWYGPGFNGRRSASGEVFNQNALTAAHRSLPFGTMVEVTNRNNGLSVVVRINDRGPFGGGRVIDLSAGAARAIGMIQTGVAPVTIDVLGANTANRN
ncbi:MAG TPA: septal ring lytic transglycosylase RlpA family protein, partial [Elainellaceae cyanobacterium]